MSTCRLCGGGGGPCCYECTIKYGSRVQSALIAAENAQRRADQDLQREREAHAASITLANERITALNEALADARSSLGVQLAELRGLREEVRGRVLVAAPAAQRSAPPLLGGRDGAGTPSTVGGRATQDPTTAPPSTEAHDEPVADPASARYSLLELD